ncbi:EF-hand domain-containing protein [Seonamhaeicola marinus]|uniref:EF-hand domain-containing protein n=1 Tax=Seonamhaeicola marinus TaxID=1912246 RepID=A0A5D0HK09_9FLAO|nr:hypothetical protein [Seonamhaeicola marinus]TYA71723.1 hypothetical protein FUA24_19395 [Seonamhaeicola marinus]
MRLLKTTCLLLGVFAFSTSYGQQDLEAKKKKQFAKADIDANGFTDFEEMKAKFGNKKTKDGKPFNIETMFKKKDLNADGKLDFKEFFAKGKKKK